MMLLIERDSGLGDAMWGSLEAVTDSIMAMTSSQQAGKMVTSGNSVLCCYQVLCYSPHCFTGVDRLRKALEEEQSRKEGAQKSEEAAGIYTEYT